MSAAREVIQEAEHLALSERDSLRVLTVLENPPKPNAKLLAAAWYASYGALPLLDAPLSLLLPLTTVEAALKAASARTPASR